MVDRARKVLNALLGIDRNVLSSEELSVDGSVCKYMLIAFCPFMLFQGTKGCIGKCKYLNHEEYYRTEYTRRGSPSFEKYEWDFIRLLVEVTLNVQGGLAVPEKFDGVSGLDILERIKELEKVFCEKYASVESLGIGGDVESAFSRAIKCERVKEELERYKEAYYAKNNGVGMGRCEICGANITMSDTDSKIDKHIRGKLHRGHTLVRNKLADLLKKFGISDITEVFPRGVHFKYVKPRFPS